MSRAVGRDRHRRGLESGGVNGYGSGIAATSLAGAIAVVEKGLSMPTHYLALICLDLGDTIMIEESEVKDADGITLRADLIPGIDDLLWDWYARRALLALVADTRVATARHVLYQHGLWDLFRVFSISEALGTQKPDRRMFDAARNHAEALIGTPIDRRLMIGNHYARDIIGGKAAGFHTCWFHWNDRYPAPAATGAADAIVRTRDALGAWVDAWLRAAEGD